MIRNGMETEKEIPIVLLISFSRLARSHSNERDEICSQDTEYSTFCPAMHVSQLEIVTLLPFERLKVSDLL